MVLCTPMPQKEPSYWLMKSEPDAYSIDTLKNDGVTLWDGIRNYQARNFMRKMNKGDKVFFYHSNCKPPGIVGVAEVASQAYPDHTAFDPSSEHPDSNSTPDNPRWFMVDVKFVEKFDAMISLDELKNHPELDGMPLLKKGNRLSIIPVSQKEWDFIMKTLR